MIKLLPALLALAIALPVAAVPGAARAAASTEGAASERLPASAARRLREYLQTPHREGYRAFAVGPEVRHSAAGLSDATPADRENRPW